MKKALLSVFIFLFTISFYISYSQNKIITDQSDQVSKLFKSQKVLPLKISYSNRYIKEKTNDSTYLKVNLSYQNDSGTWKTIDIKLRKRGNFRLENCHYSPIKIKIKKSNSKGTLFEGNKKLKLVLPCFTNKSKNDYILKEYIAYKLYEEISNYHFKTRITTISYTEIAGNKTKSHFLKGIVVEDDKVVAKRSGGEIIKRTIHPLNHDPITSVQNAFFQFMIGCTDFSTAFQHNEKLLFANNRIIPIPYDFDMSGFVNPNYAIVSDEMNELGVTSVRDRLYRGFKRKKAILQQVRQEFLDNKTKLIAIVDSYESNFEDPKQFLEARDYILDFFEILENDAQFQKQILNKLRTE